MIVVLGPKKSPGPDSEVAAEATTSDESALRDETIQAARQLASDLPQDIQALGLLGTVYNQFGKTAEAEVVWGECLERSPRRTDVFDVLAISYLTKGEFEKVVDMSRRMLAAAPNAPGVHRRLAEALLELGELDEALAAIERERSLNPDLNEVYIILGRIQLQRDAYEEALAAYARALELRPGDSRCYFGLANASARLGRRDESREYMAKFTELRAEEDQASVEKRRATDVIASAGPILASTLVDAGKIYNDAGRAEKAEALWRRAAEVDPSNAACRVQLVNLYGRNGRAQDAAAYWAQLTNIDPDNAVYHRMSGITLARLRRFDDAERELRRSVELAPRDGQGFAALAQVLRAANRNPAEAKTLIEKAVELAPNDPEIRKVYERMLKEQ